MPPAKKSWYYCFFVFGQICKGNPCHVFSMAFTESLDGKKVFKIDFFWKINEFFVWICKIWKYNFVKSLSDIASKSENIFLA